MNENQKTLKQAFYDIKNVLEHRLKTDKEFNAKVMKIIGDCCNKIKSGEHVLQQDTYEYCKALGHEDETILFIYGIVCAHRAMEQITDGKLSVRGINVKS